MSIHNTLFASRLNYCPLMWSTTFHGNLQRLHKLQKRFVRVIKNLPFYSHTYYLFDKYNIIPVTKLYDYVLCKAVKNEKGNNSSVLHRLARLQENTTTRQTCYTELWKVRMFRTTYGLQTLQNKLRRLLNELNHKHIQLEKMTCKGLRKYFNTY